MIMIKKVSTEKAPAAIGPYSQAVIAGKMLFASGQIPISVSGVAFSTLCCRRRMRATPICRCRN